MTELPNLKDQGPTPNEHHLNDPAWLRENARQELERLEQLLGRLRTAIEDEDAHLPAEVQVLPLGDGAKHEGPPPKVLEVLTGAPARRRAAEVLCATRRLEDQHPKASLRLPGVVAASAQTLALARTVNEQKTRLLEAVRLIETRKRPALLEKPFKGVMKLQAYRLFELLPEVPAVVSCTWAANTTNGERVTAKSLRQELLAELEEPAAGSDPSAWTRKIEDELRALSGVDDREILLRRRLLAPHPRANVRFNSGRELQIHAYLPFLVPDDGGWPIIETLRPPRKRRPRSDRKVETEPLIERLDVYRYRLEYRKTQTAGKALGESRAELVIEHAGGNRQRIEVQLEVGKRKFSLGEDGLDGVLNLFAMLRGQTATGIVFGDGDWALAIYPFDVEPGRGMVRSLDPTAQRIVLQLSAAQRNAWIEQIMGHLKLTA